jgi:transcription elongation factor Elf1
MTLKAVACRVCRTKHFDHYECVDCGARFGCILPSYNGRVFKYCPYCGEKLNSATAVRAGDSMPKSVSG